MNLANLTNNGLKKAPQGAKKLNSSFSLLNYIEKHFAINQGSQVTYGAGEYVEGLSTRVYVNKFERNADARRKCIEYHGTSCKVCGFDFEDVYGELGKGYIHVHHIVPISNIDKRYSVDPINDLVPVCPNCHAMLHTKNRKNKFYSLNEIQHLIKHYH